MSDDSLPALSCACATLRRATRAVTQLYDDELRAVGLKATQFTLLQVVAARGPVTQARLADILAVDSTTLSRNVRVLEGNGWVLGREGEDRRERFLVLTAAGKDVLRKAERHWNRAQDRLKSSLGDWAGLFMATDEVTRVARGR